MTAIEEHLDRVARELVERQQTVHERIACPKCGALIGQRCYNLRVTQRPRADEHTKHPHVERLRADGINLR